MDDTPRKTIRLERVLEYLIFTNLPLIVSSQDKKYKLQIKITDVEEDVIYIEPYSKESPVIIDKLMNQNLTVHAAFRGQLLVFDSHFRTEKSPKLALFKPKRASIIEYRSEQRLALNKFGAELSLNLSVSTQIHDYSIKSSDLYDISCKYISCTIERGYGLVLPGDRVTKIELMLRSNLILKTTGTIHQIDTQRSTDNSKFYYCLIKFDQTEDNALSSYDPSSNKRKIPRASLIGQDDAFVEAVYPLSPNAKLKGKILDISMSGMSILLKNNFKPIMRGLLLSPTQIQFPHKPAILTSIIITNLQTFGTDSQNLTKISCRFIENSNIKMKFISEIIQTSGNKNLVDATEEDYDRLWEFFFESGFIYHDKRNNIQNIAESLLKTYKNLIKSENSIVKTILFKDDKEIKAHISAVRFYDSAWIIQHLNAVKADGVSAGYLMVKGIIDLFIDYHSNKLAASAFVVCYFRPNNIYPATIFGQATNLINDNSISKIENLMYSTISNSQFSITEQNNDNFNVSASEASQDDLAILESLLIKKKYYTLIRIEGLTKEGFTNLSVSKEFEKINLYRLRKVFTVHDVKSNNRIFAICNYSSPGINLSELTNSFRLFYSDEKFQYNNILASILSKTVIDSYKKTAMPNPILLSEENQDIPIQFEKRKIYSYWYMNTAHTEIFHEKVQYIQQNLKDYLKAFKSRERQSDN